MTAPDDTRRAARRGAAGAAAVTVLVTALRGFDGELGRDPSVYAYAAQQAVAGTPPYESIVDPKGPLASLVPALGVAVGRALGLSDLTGIRVAMAGALLAAVVGIFALALAVTSKVSAALAAALVSLGVDAWSRSAWEGPEVKVLATAFAVWCLWATVARHWASAGALLVLAGATWQPVALALLAAASVTLVAQPRRREAARRFGLGVLGPVVVLLGYLGVTGALAEAWAYAVRFPFSGIAHAERTPGEKVHAVLSSGAHHFGLGGPLVLLGLVAVVGLAALRWHGGDRRDPLVLAVLPATVTMVGYTAVDYQGYPDLLPLVPFGCLGAAALAARATTPAGLVTVAVVPAVLLAAAVQVPAPGADLAEQRRSACALDAVVGDGEVLALGDPTPLVLTGRTNHDRFVYISSGIGRLRVEGTPGGLGAWHDEVLARRPVAVAIMGVDSTVSHTFQVVLRRAGYAKVLLGPWRVYLDRRVASGAEAEAAWRRCAQAGRGARPGARLETPAGVRQNRSA